MQLAIDKSINMKDMWLDRLESIDFAFQPIISIATGKVYAVEALLRNYELAGFKSIDDFFDYASKDGMLFNIDLYLREKAISKFVKIPFYSELKLFYNYDPRCLEMSDYITGSTEVVLRKYNVKDDQFCFEINEKYKIQCFNSFNKIFSSVKKRGIKIAIDDFGSGFAGLELFYHSDPNYIKFDRFLISEIDKDIKKKILCSQIISLSKKFGVITIAEGVETQDELNICHELGFNMVQGYFLQRPTKVISEIELGNKILSNKIISDNRKENSDRDFIKKVITKLDTVCIDDDFAGVFDKFHDKLQYNFFPVIDTHGYPLGIIHERDIKKYVYLPYGKEILINKSISKSIKEFISHCPVVDINTTQDIILELYVNNPDSEGVIIIEDQKYCGFLTAKSLLNIIHDKNIKYAVEVNPLTKLPGNMMIEKFIDDSIQIIDSKKILVYFDFDNFKPFNDRFGFRQGDKAIKLFADMLKKEISLIRDSFAGHIGGDDFFAGFKTDDDNGTIEIIKNIITKFTDGVATFYMPDEFISGKYVSKDRYGTEREFELLTVSAAMIIIGAEDNDITNTEISAIFADLKCEAKKSVNRFTIKYYSPECLAKTGD